MAVLGFLAVLSICFVAVVMLSPTGLKLAGPFAVERGYGLGSRAGPLADQMSIRGDTVGRRTASEPPGASR